VLHSWEIFLPNSAAWSIPQRCRSSRRRFPFRCQPQRWIHKSLILPQFSGSASPCWTPRSGRRRQNHDLQVVRLAFQDPRYLVRCTQGTLCRSLNRLPRPRPHRLLSARPRIWVDLPFGDSIPWLETRWFARPGTWSSGSFQLQPGSAWRRA